VRLVRLVWLRYRKNYVASQFSMTCQQVVYHVVGSEVMNFRSIPRFTGLLESCKNTHKCPVVTSYFSNPTYCEPEAYLDPAQNTTIQRDNCRVTFSSYLFRGTNYVEPLDSQE